MPAREECFVKIGVHVPDFTYPGGAAPRSRADLARIAAGRRRRRGRPAQRHGPRLADRSGRAGRARHARGVHHARLPRRAHRAGQAADARHRRHVPRARGCSRRWSRRSTCSPAGGRARHRRGVERGGVRAASACSSRRPRSASSGSRRRCRSACRCGRGDEEPYEGEHYQLGRTLNSPQPLTGRTRRSSSAAAARRRRCGSWRSTRMPATSSRARSCAHKLDVLRGHCDGRRPRLRRDREDRAVYNFDLGPDGGSVEQTLADLRAMADLGIQVAHGRVENVHDLVGLRAARRAGGPCGRGVVISGRRRGRRRRPDQRS